MLSSTTAGDSNLGWYGDRATFTFLSFSPKSLSEKTFQIPFRPAPLLWSIKTFHNLFESLCLHKL